VRSDLFSTEQTSDYPPAFWQGMKRERERGRERERERERERNRERDRER
jgi:hypothetical protein